MARGLYAILPVLLVFVLAFALVVSLHTVSTAQGSYPFPDDPPRNDNNGHGWDMVPGSCCQVVVQSTNGGPARVVLGVWTANGCSCDGSMFPGSPCAFACP